MILFRRNLPLALLTLQFGLVPMLPASRSLAAESLSSFAVKNEESSRVRAATAAGAPVTPAAVRAAAGFVHPGLLQSRDDLERMRRAVNAREQPIYSGYEMLAAHPASQSEYRMQGPLEVVGRNPAVGQGAYDADANAAYQCALRWAITGDQRYADKAKEIVNAWAATLKSITGRDAILMAGLGPFKMVNAAEILRHTDSGWSEAEAQRAAGHFREVIYPVIEDFAPFANGNWDTAALKTMMAIAVYAEDRAMYERALGYYMHGAGNGRPAHYIINETGQCQESGRDQQHTQLGLAHLADACEIAWHQGLDLYGHDNNRLLRGFEYTAKYNLGEAVPFSETVDQTGKYHHSAISTNGRGRFRPVFEQVYHHYVNRRGISAPFTAKAADRIRPEGAGFPGADHTGFGTLLYSRASNAAGESRNSVPVAISAGVPEDRPFDSAQVWKASAKSGAAGLGVTSPDGKVAVQFRLSDDGRPRYNISYNRRPVVLDSGLGFQPAFTNSFSLAGTRVTEHAAMWTNRFGEKQLVPDHYRELTVDLVLDTGRSMQMVFRAYNEGAAFRYQFPEQAMAPFVFEDECSEFRFPPGTYAYEEHGTEGVYDRVPVEQMQPFCEKPLTIEYSGGYFASLNEAANLAYPRLLLSPSGSGGLVSALGGDTSNTARRNQRHDSRGTLKPGAASPWRMLILGDRPGDLLERNYLQLNLNPPCALRDTEWIRPGKAMRDTLLALTNSKAIVDFSATAGLQHLLLDSGWYGSEDSAAGDATRSRAGRTRFGNPPAPMDIHELIQYGRMKNVGVILYVDRRQMKKQRDVLLPLYEQWGVAGVKIGFVDVGPQDETAWITETIRRAAEHHLVLNIHDGFRSSGLSRTYPNLLTVEGIRGNEHFPTADHNCTLPFTRYVGGPGDYTICYYDARLKTSHAHQLAMAVICFSPLQSILWYDLPSEYEGEPELEFFRQVPTVWDETRVLAGEIGKFAAVARRKGQQWFIGVINGNDARRLKIDLRVLGAGNKYTAWCYSDDDTVPTKTKVRVETRMVEGGSAMELALKPAGGYAMRLVPAER